MIKHITYAHGVKRIGRICLDCERRFMALGKWQNRCQPCYSAYRTHKANMIAARNAEAIHSTEMDAAEKRRGA